jgi:hypothetical protein
MHFDPFIHIYFKYQFHNTDTGMKKLLQKALTLICLLFIYYCNVSAQAFSANYTYDLTGNRIKETVIYLSITNDQSLIVHLDTLINKDTLTKDSIKLPEDGWEKGPVDSTSNMKITIYPNPTHGILLVEIGGVDADILNNNNNFIRVCDVKGIEILSVRPLNYKNSIDMSAVPNGVYVIVISVNGNNKSYKVIKN